MVTYVAVFALFLGYVALVAAYFALRTLAKLRRATAVLSRGARGPAAQASLIEATQRNTERTELVAEQVAELRTAVTLQPGGGVEQAGALRKVALVRYDAFNEMSGRMSFSLALLDEQGDGVTISAIAGHADTSVYAKGVVGGRGENELSPEEAQAVSSAMAKRRGLMRRKSA